VRVAIAASSASVLFIVVSIFMGIID